MKGAKANMNGRFTSGRSLRLLATIALVVPLAAACGSSSKSAGSGSAKLHGVVHVGTIVPLTGSSLTFPELASALTATAKYINATGGVGGRELDVTICDDQSNANGAATCARNAVSDNLVAEIGLFSLYNGSITPILESAHIVDFDPAGASGAEIASPYTFSLNPALYGFYIGAGVSMGARCKEPGLIASQGPAASLIQSLVNAGLSKYHEQLAKTVLVPSSITDFTAQATQISQGTDCIEVAESASIGTTIIGNLKQVGAKQRIFGPAGDSLAISVVQQFGSYLNGAVATDFFPPQSSSAWNAYDQAMRRYGGPSDLSSSTAHNSWIALNLFRTIAANVKNLDSNSFYNAAKATTHLQLPGLTPVMNLSRPFAVAKLSGIYNPNVLFETAQNGQLTAIGSGGGFVDITPELQVYGSSSG